VLHPKGRTVLGGDGRACVSSTTTAHGLRRLDGSRWGGTRQTGPQSRPRSSDDLRPTKPTGTVVLQAKLRLRPTSTARRLASGRGATAALRMTRLRPRDRLQTSTNAPIWADSRPLRASPVPPDPGPHREDRVRSEAPSLSITFCTCVLMVLAATPRTSAIWWLVSPSTRSASTSHSREVSLLRSPVSGSVISLCSVPRCWMIAARSQGEMSASPVTTPRMDAASSAGSRLLSRYPAAPKATACTNQVGSS